MRASPSLIGKKFGLWTVESQAKTRTYGYQGRNPASFKYWNCKCDCGVLGEVPGTSLMLGLSKSCGCSKKKPKYQYGYCFGRAYRNYKGNATRRKLEFALTPEEAYLLFTSPCYYTGREPANKIEWRDHEPFIYNGIDRIDSTKGYSMENCVPCSFEVNRAKSDLSHEEFVEMCKKVAERF